MLSKENSAKENLTRKRGRSTGALPRRYTILWFRQKFEEINIPIWMPALVGWFIWIFMGTVFYAYRNGDGWLRGFYMAVNVGYSIGWGFPVEIDNATRWFSMVYLLIGASMVAAALSIFASSAVAKSHSWYQDLLKEEEKNSVDATLYTKLKDVVMLNIESIKVIGSWFLMIIILTVWSLSSINQWSFAEALYFAVSSLSTGGLFAIPNESPDWYFGFVGVMAAVGVPLMGYAMTHIATLGLDYDVELAKDAIIAPVTDEEMEMMQKVGLEDGDGSISRAEFILLMAVRLDAIRAPILEFIRKRFDELDVDNSGDLSYAELQEKLSSERSKRESKRLETQDLMTVMGSSIASVFVDIENAIEHTRTDIENVIEHTRTRGTTNPSPVENGVECSDMISSAVVKDDGLDVRTSAPSLPPPALPNRSSEPSMPPPALPSHMSAPSLPPPALPLRTSTPSSPPPAPPSESARKSTPTSPPPPAPSVRTNVVSSILDPLRKHSILGPTQKGKPSKDSAEFEVAEIFRPSNFETGFVGENEQLKRNGSDV